MKCTAASRGPPCDSAASCSSFRLLSGLLKTVDIFINFFGSDRSWDKEQIDVWMIFMDVYSVSQKSVPLRFSDIFPKRLGMFSPNFTCLLYVAMYARLQIFIQLSATLTTLCHIKRDHPVHIVCSMSTIGRNARVQTFAKVIDSFVDHCLLLLKLAHSVKQ